MKKDENGTLSGLPKEEGLPETESEKNGTYIILNETHPNEVDETKQLGKSQNSQEETELSQDVIRKLHDYNQLSEDGKIREDAGNNFDTVHAIFYGPLEWHRRFPKKQYLDLIMRIDNPILLDAIKKTLSPYHYTERKPNAGYHIIMTFCGKDREDVIIGIPELTNYTPVKEHFPCGMYDVVSFVQRILFKVLEEEACANLAINLHSSYWSIMNQFQEVDIYMKYLEYVVGKNDEHKTLCKKLNYNRQKSDEVVYFSSEESQSIVSFFPKDIPEDYIQLNAASLKNPD